MSVAALWSVDARAHLLHSAPAVGGAGRAAARVARNFLGHTCRTDPWRLGSAPVRVLSIDWPAVASSGRRTAWKWAHGKTMLFWERGRASPIRASIPRVFGFRCLAYTYRPTLAHTNHMDMHKRSRTIPMHSITQRGNWPQRRRSPWPTKAAARQARRTARAALPVTCASNAPSARRPHRA